MHTSPKKNKSKKRRGRPPGSKNKKVKTLGSGATEGVKQPQILRGACKTEDSSITEGAFVKRKRGRPLGSKTKKLDALKPGPKTSTAHADRDTSSSTRTKKTGLPPLPEPILNSQKDFVEYIKMKLKRSIRHNRRVDGGIEGEYPFQSLLVNPIELYEIVPNELSESFFEIKSVFIWVPEFFFRDEFENGRPACPFCHMTDLVESNGWNPHCRTIKTGQLLENIMLMGLRYSCKRCKKSYSAYDKDVMMTFPLNVQGSFPFKLTHRAGYSSTHDSASIIDNNLLLQNV